MEQFQEMMMKQLSSQMGGMDLERMMSAMNGGGVSTSGEVKEQESEQVKEDEVKEDEVEEVNTEGSEELNKEEGGAE